MTSEIKFLPDEVLKEGVALMDAHGLACNCCPGPERFIAAVSEMVELYISTTRSRHICDITSVHILTVMSEHLLKAAHRSNVDVKQMPKEVAERLADMTLMSEASARAYRERDMYIQEGGVPQ